MRGPVVQPIVIAAGGTGGHFFPAEALAGALMKHGERVVLFTDQRSGGLASPVFTACERYVIEGAGLSGRSIFRAAQGGAAMLRGVVRARRLLMALRPKAIIGFGGYPSVAPIMAARLMANRPMIFLHEQNAVLGRANRLLARMADYLALSFEKTSAVPASVATTVTGNPVRPMIVELAGKGYPHQGDQIQLLVLGGSLGAKIFGTLIPQALALLSPTMRARLNIVQQCREAELDEARAIFAAAGLHATLSPFFDDVARRLAAAHLIIARAGASSVAEIATAGRPALFIPLPTAIDDHQRANADALVAAGGGWRLDQAGLSAETLARQIEICLSDPEDLVQRAQAAQRFGRPDATEKLAALVQTSLVKSR
ncbi:MAG: undecaprenyldiphospho-muramoylpentapeptide beta-N-acetylglucosaminyltransferase [Rhodospirillales bacterium 20-60-12]|nr:MAG: undecaprenyldiphospho-muramoylpentapeptide beta-N-acetylglucosaminyltransferase [Rhodospirillales bacterium 20-60-12]HQT66763.1 undecaprenyldiphospho-muramoylpentapeptide beta-N-acetylglucosaminyltransferase [Acetobacteraceae bacterium]